MILTSTGRKSSSYGQVLEYITREGAIVKGSDGQPLLFTHNVRGITLPELEREFLDNEANRAHPRKRSNRLFHDWLSWHPSDSDNLDEKKIEALAREYFRLRNENALYVAGIHKDKHHTHLHVLVSGTEAYSGNSIRMSKGEFAQMKAKLQAFEQEQFPELTASVVEHGSHEHGQKGRREYKLEHRTGTISRKEEVKQILETTYGESISKEEFISKLHERGLETYERGGKTAGVDDARHMRFSTLGFTDERFEVLDKRQERLSDLEQLRDNGVEPTAQAMGEELSEEEKARAKELDDLRDARR